MLLQSVVRAIYPPQCIACGALTEEEFGLCPTCWRDTSFAEGLVCDTCGVTLPGEDEGKPEFCDDCQTIARPWDRGRAVMLYQGTGRRIALALKHADRTDIARLAGPLMARAVKPVWQEGTVIVPVPLHWSRMLRRRYNQAALLARAMGRLLDAEVAPDALIRSRQTRPLEGHDREARFRALDRAIAPHPRRGKGLQDRAVLIVDDVMTSGATFAAATEAAYAAGASRVSVLALARVAKDA